MKGDFPLLRNSDLVWLDNASTTQKPEVVLTAMDQFYRQYNANVHRGLYQLSEQATAAYEQARDTVQQFVGAQSREEIIFTSGTTASLNLVAAALGQLLLHPGDVVLLSPLEHHSNLVPWQMATQRYGATLEWFDLTADDCIDQTTLASTFHQRVKIVAISHIANASGSIQPLAQIIQLAHAHNIPVVVDAAQSVPHRTIDVTTLDCDFLAFSGHKVCGPTGTGVLYGKRDWLEQLPPWQGGGDMIRTVTVERSTWNDLPYKFEAGTPNIAGAIGLAAAIRYLQQLGMQRIVQDTDAVYNYLLDELQQLEYIQLFGPTQRSSRSSIASFTMQGVHAHDVAQLLDNDHIAVRAGHHCAQPLMQRWGVPATVRASVYFYNATSDIDRLVNGLNSVYEHLSRKHS